MRLPPPLGVRMVVGRRLGDEVVDSARVQEARVQLVEAGDAAQAHRGFELLVEYDRTGKAHSQCTA